MQLVVCHPGKLDLTKDVSILLKNEVKIVTINDAQFFLDASEKRLLKIRKTFENPGIKIHSVHAPGGSLITLESKNREETIKIYKKLIYHLSLTGTEIMVFHIGSIENKKHQSLAFSIAMESLHAIAETAEKYKITLALENDSPNFMNGFPKSFCSNSQILLKLLRKVNSPYLKACYDIGHTHMGEKKIDVRGSGIYYPGYDPEYTYTGKRNSLLKYQEGESIKDGIKNLGNWIVTIHMQDNNGAHDFHLQPGYGTINWVDFVKALQDISYDRPITIESYPWPGASVKHMLDEVKALLKDAGADIPTNLTLKPNRNWLNEFSSKWRTEKVADIMIRCKKCGHYVIWSPEGGSCVCNERKR